MGVAWERVSKKQKSLMGNDEIHHYFDSQVRVGRKCPNQDCNCVGILVNNDIRASVVRYLCWFDSESKYKQYSIVQASLEALNSLPMVSIHPVNPDNFCDYNRLMRDYYQMLGGQVKKNHNFSWTSNGATMKLRQSNLDEHKEVLLNLRKKGNMGRHIAQQDCRDFTCCFGGTNL